MTTSTFGMQFQHHQSHRQLLFYHPVTGARLVSPCDDEKFPWLLPHNFEASQEFSFEKREITFTSNVIERIAFHSVGGFNARLGDKREDACLGYRGDATKGMAMLAYESRGGKLKVTTIFFAISIVILLLSEVLSRRKKSIQGPSTCAASWKMSFWCVVYFTLWFHSFSLFFALFVNQKLKFLCRQRLFILLPLLFIPMMNWVNFPSASRIFFSLSRSLALFEANSFAITFSLLD